MAGAIFVLLGLGILVWVVWRLSSQRHTLPCPAWLSWMVELDNPFTQVNRAGFIVEHLDVKPGMQVLDAGCGPGRLTLPLAKAAGPQGEVLALDIQEAMLSQVRAKAEAAGLQNIQYLHGGLGEGRLPAEAFDRAVLVTVLGEIPQAGAAFEEIFRALKPGGLLSVTEVIFDPHFQPRETVRRHAAAAGFQERAFLGRKLAYTLHFTKPA